jgi:esterase
MLYQLSYSRFKVGYYIIPFVQPQLVFNDYGTGHPIIILHGLFGSSDNWATVSKHLATEYRVISVDLRNHGRSFHSPHHRYLDLAADIFELVQHLGLKSISILGHSMGGKAAMQFAAQYPHITDHCIVVDIYPIRYPSHHDEIFAGLTAVDLSQVRRRGDADIMMSPHISDSALRLFLLKSLAFDENGGAFWRFNLNQLIHEYPYIIGEIEIVEPILIPTLFIMGALSEYRLPEGEMARTQWFLNSRVEVVENAGHWVHAQYPTQVVEMVFSHLNR